jgi:hypothetical protein
MIEVNTIEEKIAVFMREREVAPAWLLEAVRRHGFLPLYVGWFATLGLRPDGTFVRLEGDARDGRLTLLKDPYWQRMAICQGAKKYPELRSFIPERPPAASTCPSCQGSGEIAGAPHLICICGGAGWIVAGEPTEPLPG